MSVRVRIAPSPTGILHIGTARTAVFNWLFARHHGGTFILRVEDTDRERSRPEFTHNILEGLRWLGLTWDEGPIFQTDRLDRYRERVQELLDQGLAYYSYETEAELEALRETQRAQGEAPRYNNQHRTLTAEQIAQFVAEGRQPVVRFRIEDDREILWHDLVRGEVRWQGRDLGGDMVVARADGQALYNLAVVVDDIDMGITHVIRGEDHIANTAKQILLYEAFGVTPPQFAHTPLILNAEGRKLSKRDGVTSISDFQAMGYVAPALANYMTLLGWSPPAGREVFTLAEAAAAFDLGRVNRAGAKFDWERLNWLNSHYLHALPPEELCDLLIPFWAAAGYAFDPQADRPWLELVAALIGPSLTVLKDAAGLSQFFFTPQVSYDSEAIAQLQQPGVVELLQVVSEHTPEPGTLTPAGLQAVVQAAVKTTGLKKGVVMKSLRAALMGQMHGPDLSQSWVILNQRGFDRDRLAAAGLLLAGSGTAS
ncbi:MAG: glutamate--tRNA ligase [Gloeomargaritaceae cyanobacterium C42_A2020_066]|nr:glutamate--tRNA ligase [Gloeomargaritaceae cyanobacterium C42_A2020_066]